jgi:hypothetical protein
MSLPAETNLEQDAPAGRYRAMTPSAVVSVVLGSLSILTAFSWFLVILPLVGIGLGWRALRQIRAAPEEWTGRRVARLGVGLSVGFWAIGYGWLIFARTSEVPYGYQRLSYEVLQPDPVAAAEPIPQAAQDMQDKRVFVKGYMQPRRQQTGIREFILCPTNGDCPFCTPNPKRTEMIRIVLQGDLETIYTTHQVGVGGRFQVDPKDPSGVPYTIEADYIR